MTKQTNSDHQFTNADTDKALTTAGLEFYPPDMSEAGAAEVFSEWATDALLWCDSLGWLIWSGTHWIEDTNKALALAIEYTARMLAEAQEYFRNTLKINDSGKLEPDETAKAYLQFAAGFRTRSKIVNVLELSKARLAVAADALDSEWWALNTQAGIVDLRTSQISPHDPRRLHTKITACGPGDTGAEMWQNSLRKVTREDASLEAYLQVKLGAACFGKVFIEGMDVALGGGRNGKSTTFNAIGKVLDTYCGTIDPTILTTERSNRGAVLAELRGKRLVICGELEEGWRLSISTLKRICSTDVIQIEKKYHDPEMIVPSHSIIMFSNYLPRIGSNDAGTWRRINILPFNAQMPQGRGEIKNYAEELAEKAGPAILAWLLEGARLAWQEGFRFTVPACVEQATETYRAQEDWLSNFINECCIVNNPADRTRRTQGSILYGRYKEYAQSMGEYTRRNRDFAQALEEHGFTKEKDSHDKCVYWYGISVI